MFVNNTGLKNLNSDNSTAQQLGLKSDTALTVCYARLYSHDQKADPDRQQVLLESYCAAQGWPSIVIRDLGSGMNYRKEGLVTVPN